MLFPVFSAAQVPVATPFDLLPRVSAAQETDTVDILASSNPFDLVRTRTVMEAPRKNGPGFRIDSRRTNRMTAKQKEDVYQRFIFVMVLVMVILLTIIVTLFRVLLLKIWQAFKSDILLNQLYREQGAGMYLAYGLLYLLFFLNAGIFTFLACRHLQIELAPTNMASLATVTFGISGFFLLKHLLLGYAGYIFSIQRETGLYQFTIMIFHVIIGLFLAIGILFMAYAPEGTRNYWLFGVAGSSAAVYLFLLLRGMFIAAPFLAHHKFHFLLYICTVEIAPVVLVAKLLMSQEGI
ncbi:MAG: hypothetical protein RLY31_2610 [Bacteroidota bacterium]|jgi:hypothetical protein